MNSSTTTAIDPSTLCIFSLCLFQCASVSVYVCMNVCVCVCVSMKRAAKIVLPLPLPLLLLAGTTAVASGTLVVTFA